MQYPNAIQALVTETQKTVTGEVRMKLYNGNVMQAGRPSRFSMYSVAFATMEGGQEEASNQDDTSGFIALNALRLKATSRQGKEEVMQASSCWSFSAALPALPHHEHFLCGLRKTRAVLPRSRLRSGDERNRG